MHRRGSVKMYQRHGAACPRSPWEGRARGATRPARGWRWPARGRGLWAHGDKRGLFGRAPVSGPALLEPVAFPVHLQDVDVVGDGVEQSAGEALAAGLRQRDVSEFVDDRETDLGDLGLEAKQSLLVAQALEDPLRRVPLLARHVPVCVRLDDRVDAAGDPVQLGPPHRLRPAIARRRRIAQHRLHRPAVDAEPARRPSPKPTRPPPGGAFLRRRDRTARPPRVAHYSAAVNPRH